MIYIILSIPFLFAFIYSFSVYMISRCAKPLKKNGLQVIEFGEIVYTLDLEKAGKYITLAAIAFYPAWPVLTAVKAIKSFTKWQHE